MAEQIVVSHENGTRIITMRRPDKKNALTGEMYAAIADAINTAQADVQIRCLIITGSSGVFTAGNDLNDFLAWNKETKQKPAQTLPAMTLLQALNSNQKPLIGAVDGPAIGIGTTIMFHCDYVIASSTALFSTPFTRLGLTPEGASSQLVPAAIGHQRAFAMLVMGRVFDADAAREAGFVNEVVAPGHVDSEARKVAREICALPAEAVVLSRRLLRLPPTSVAERLDHEARLFAQRLGSAEAIGAFERFFSRRNEE